MCIRDDFLDDLAIKRCLFLNKPLVIKMPYRICRWCINTIKQIMDGQFQRVSGDILSS